MLSLVVPTRGRPATLARTLDAIGALQLPGGAEVVVVDNASDPPAVAPKTLQNGVPVRLLHNETNRGAAARNDAAHAACNPWLLMLDDDSYPIDTGFLDVLENVPADVAAIGAEITLPNGSRESGGLPEVIVGCGALIRRDVFLDVGGYDETFGFYAEEYDLCATLIRTGHRVVHDSRFRVLHEKTNDERDMGMILRRLVRNNGWVWARHAPSCKRNAMLRETVVRYARIARKEKVFYSYCKGLAELFGTFWRRPREPLGLAAFDRFTGLAAARNAVQSCESIGRGSRIAIVDRGKHDWAIETALHEMGATVVGLDDGAEVLAIGSLSPGPAADAAERWRVKGQAAFVVTPFAPVLLLPML